MIMPGAVVCRLLAPHRVVDKLLFGSDYPLWTPTVARDGLLELATMKPVGLPHIRPETIEHLLDGDPREALGLRSGA